MKKRIPKTLVFLVLLAAAVAVALLLASCDAGGKDSPATHADSVVRVHIRANSNTTEDQGVKLEVRDALTGYLTEVLNGTEDKAAALAVLDGERGNIAKIAQDELYRNGFDYKVRVELKREVFPERVYDGYVFPEGEYDALIVSLGEGVGDNWWCVAFPPLCFVPADGDEKIVYKSWVKEMLEKIFG